MDDDAWGGAENYDGEQKYADEFSAYDRTGGTVLENLLSVANVIDSKDDKKKNLSPKDRVLTAIDAICRGIAENLSSSGAKSGLHRGIRLDMSEAQINEILERANVTEKIEYKNPLGFILGFLATNGGGPIRKDNIEIILDKILPEFGKENGIEPADVIRYARFWNISKD